VPTTLSTRPAEPAAGAILPRALTAATLPEVRWAAASTGLFAAGGAAQLAGAPPLLWWTLYLACYGTGGWTSTC
jgi:hypothetical protein